MVGVEKAKGIPLALVQTIAFGRYGDVEKARAVRAIHPLPSYLVTSSGVMGVISSKLGLVGTWCNVVDERTVRDVPDPNNPEIWLFQIICQMS